MGVLQRDLRSRRASIDTGTGERRVGGQRALHGGRGTYLSFQKDLGISTDEGTAKILRQQEKDFQGQVAKRKSEIGAIESGLLKEERGMEGDMIPVKYYTSGGQVQNYKLSRGTAKSLYDNPDVFAVYSEKDMEYTPTSRDQARYHTGGNRNIEGYKYESVERKGSIGKQLGPQTKYIQTPKEGGGQYEQNVLHLRAGTSRGSHEFAKALDDVQRQTDAMYAEAQKSVATGKRAISGARGVLKGTVAQRQSEWDAVHAKYAKRRETMREILGGLDFG